MHEMDFESACLLRHAACQIVNSEESGKASHECCYAFCQGCTWHPCQAAAKLKPDAGTSQALCTNDAAEAEFGPHVRPTSLCRGTVGAGHEERFTSHVSRPAMINETHNLAPSWSLKIILHQAVKANQGTCRHRCCVNETHSAACKVKARPHLHCTAYLIMAPVISASSPSYQTSSDHGCRASASLLGI